MFATPKPGMPFAKDVYPQLLSLLLKIKLKASFIAANKDDLPEPFLPISTVILSANSNVVFS